MIHCIVRAAELKGYIMQRHEDSSPTASIDPIVGKTVAEILGEISWLMTQDPAHAGAAINRLETHVMPGIVLKQFHIRYVGLPKSPDSENTKPNLQPISVEVWAMVNEAVAERLDCSPEAVLSVPEWRSGTVRRVMISAKLPQHVSPERSNT